MSHQTEGLWIHSEGRYVYMHVPVWVSAYVFLHVYEHMPVHKFCCACIYMCMLKWMCTWRCLFAWMQRDVSLWSVYSRASNTFVSVDALYGSMGCICPGMHLCVLMYVYSVICVCICTWAFHESVYVYVYPCTCLPVWLESSVLTISTNISDRIILIDSSIPAGRGLQYGVLGNTTQMLGS